MFSDFKPSFIYAMHNILSLLWLKIDMVIAQNSNDFKMLNTMLHVPVHVLHIAGNVSTEILNSICAWAVIIVLGINVLFRFISVNQTCEFLYFCIERVYIIIFTLKPIDRNLEAYGLTCLLHLHLKFLMMIVPGTCNVYRYVSTTELQCLLGVIRSCDLWWVCL